MWIIRTYEELFDIIENIQIEGGVSQLMLTGKQRRYLRAMGTGLDPISHIGKAGLVDTLVQQLSDALEARELIKVRVIPNAPVLPKEVAPELADNLGAELVQIVGRNMLFFRRSEKKPTIILPD